MARHCANRPISALLCIAAVVAGCDDSHTGGSVSTVTQTVVDIDAEEFVRLQAVDAHVEVWSKDGTSALDQMVALGSEGETDWPLHLPVVPKDPDKRDAFAVRISALDDTGRVIVKREAVLGFAEGHVERVPLPLADACLYRECPSGYECVTRECAETDECLPTYCAAVCGADAAGDAKDLPCPQSQTVEGVFVDGEAGEDNDTACKSPATPCKTIAFAWDTYVALGDQAIVNVRGGQTYPPVALMNGKGTLDKPHLLRAWPGTEEPPLIEGNGHPATQACEIGADWVIVEGFDITNGGDSGIRMRNASDLEARHNHVFGNGIDGSKRGGILVDGQATIRDFRIYSNLIRDNVGNGTDGNGSGIRVKYFNGGDLGLDIRNNVIAHNSNVGAWIESDQTHLSMNRIYGNGSHGAIVEASSTDLVIEYNRVCTNDGDGLHISGAKQTVLHNSIVNNGADGCSILAFDPDGEGLVDPDIAPVPSYENHIEANLFIGNDGVGLRFQAVDTEGTVTTHNGFADNRNGVSDPDDASSEPGTDVSDKGIEIVGTRCLLELPGDSPFASKAADGTNLGAR